MTVTDDQLKSHHETLRGMSEQKGGKNWLSNETVRDLADICEEALDARWKKRQAEEAQLRAKLEKHFAGLTDSHRDRLIALWIEETRRAGERPGLSLTRRGGRARGLGLPMGRANLPSAAD